MEENEEILQGINQVQAEVHTCLAKVGNTPLYARFIWREPGKGQPYDIEWIMNLAVTPRPGEEVVLKAEANHIHSFAFDEVFVVEKVEYDIRSRPPSSDPQERWKVLAYEQSVLIYVQPRDKSGWATVQRIKKEFRSPRSRTPKRGKSV